MVLAAYSSVLHKLRERAAHIVIVSTMAPEFSSRFVRELGFSLPGTLVSDPERRTHAACGLRSSIYASLVMPFKEHLSTFGPRALVEALRVSLRNATSGAGSSWQQGAAIVLEHPALGSAAGGAARRRKAGKAAGEVRCTWAHRENFPGDWLPVEDVMAAGLGIRDAPAVSFPERLDFVIAARDGSRSGSSSDTGAGGAPPPAPATKRAADGPPPCDGEVCSVGALRRRLDDGKGKKQPRRRS